MSRYSKSKYLNGFLVGACLMLLYLSYGNVFPAIPSLVYFALMVLLILCLIHQLS